MIRIKDTIKNSVPIITCSPWNPVATKKVVPNTESAIVYDVSKYSIACKAVNTTPSNIVKIKPFIVSFLLPAIIALCDHVILAPELNRIAVFNNGTSKAFNGVIPTGGHTLPISIVGTKALWKNPQKNEKKNTTSVKINSIIPILNPFCTTKVCNPKYVPSLITSLHQTTITNSTNIKDTVANNSPYTYL